MKTLMGIIFFHLLVIWRAKQAEGDGVPLFSTFFITALLVGFVMFMMYTMEEPE